MHKFKLVPMLLMIVVPSSSIGGKEELIRDSSEETVVAVNPDLFLEGTNVSTVPCTLSDGTKTTCYQIVAGTPNDHNMGPWCPDNIANGAEAGGIWLENGEVHDVDGEFIRNLATFYNDDSWLMYDANGDIYVTKTEEDCINAANPNVGEAYKNFCVECIPDYIADVTRTWLIPTKPVKLATSAYFARGAGGPGKAGGRPEPGQRPERGDRPAPGNRPERRQEEMGFGPQTHGIAFNGVEFSASAPVDNILGAYTIAPFDDAGGHINVHQGYHYHAATGVSTQIKQKDGHAAMIGYAMDGHGIYAQLNEDGNEPADLDGCRGHYDDVRGYHYHVDAPGANNFINCLAGAYIN